MRSITEYYVVTDEVVHTFTSYKTAKKTFDAICVSAGLYKVIHDDDEFWQYYPECYEYVLLHGVDIVR